MMESMNNVEINVLNDELKRLHDLLTLTACDKEMRDKVLDMIKNLHESNLVPKYFVEKGSNIQF